MTLNLYIYYFIYRTPSESSSNRGGQLPLAFGAHGVHTPGYVPGPGVLQLCPHEKPVERDQGGRLRYENRSQALLLPALPAFPLLQLLPAQMNWLIPIRGPWGSYLAVAGARLHWVGCEPLGQESKSNLATVI